MASGGTLRSKITLIIRVSDPPVSGVCLFEKAVTQGLRRQDFQSGLYGVSLNLSSTGLPGC